MSSKRFKFMTHFSRGSCLTGDMKKKLTQILPWLFCALLFWYLFRKVPPQKLWQSLQIVRVPVFVFWSLLYFAVVLVGDAVGIHYFLRRFVAPMTFGETLKVRGASFLLALVNYLVGQAAMAYYAKSRYQAKLAKAFGTISFITAMDLCLVVSSGILALGFSERAQAFWGFSRGFCAALVFGLWLFYALWALFWRLYAPRQLAKNSASRWRRWLARDLFLIFREAQLRDYVMLFATRAPILLIVIANIQFGLWAFGARLPWTEIFLYNPIVLLVSSLPLTPAGLGTSQFLMVSFFAPSVTGSVFASTSLTAPELIFSVSFIWVLANQILKALFGAYCLSTTPQMSKK